MKDACDTLFAIEERLIACNCLRSRSVFLENEDRHNIVFTSSLLQNELMLPDRLLK